jgi:uncharacterized protein YaiE (UPF0345 family)
MASTYVNDLRLNEMATGDASGSWGTVTNTNLELIGEAFSYGTETIGDADSTLTIADGAADAARSFYLKITSSVDLTTTRIVTLGPNTVSKVWMIENATTGSQVITIKQGSGATINVPNGQVKMISTDGAGSGGAVLDLLVDVDLTGTTTLVNLDVSGAVDIAGDLTLSAGGDGALRFTAASSVKVLDNNAAALVFEEADNAYMTFVTTDGSEAVKFDKALDINAATQIDATVTVGVDDTGYDVKFFGATAGAYMLWDESADDLILGGAAGLSVNSTALVTGVLTTTAATVSNGGGQFNGAINVGVDDTGYDVKFFGATAGAYMLWDESADDLILGGAAGLSVDGSAVINQYLTLKTTDDQVNGWILYTGTTDKLEFNYNGSGNAEVVIDSTGNVGIGTSSPDELLHIHGATQSYIKLTDDDSGQGATDGALFAFDGSSATQYIWNYENGPTVFATNNTERMRIDSSGGLITNPAAGGHAVFNEGGIDADFRVDSVALTSPMRLRFTDDNNGSSNNPLSDGYKAGLQIENYYGGASPSVNGTKVAKLQLTTVTASGYGASGSMMVLAESNGYNAGALVFATGSNSSALETERMRISSTGGLITNPVDGGHAIFNEGGVDADFRVESDGNANMLFVDGGNNNLMIGNTVVNPASGFSAQAGFGYAASGQVQIAATSDLATLVLGQNQGTNGSILEFRKQGTEVGSISVTGSATAYNTSSDQRLKENIADADDAGSKIDAIQVRKYDWKADGSHQDYGMVAQELLEVAPDAVYQPEDPEEMMGVDYSKLVPMLIKEIQSLRARVADLES